MTTLVALNTMDGLVLGCDSLGTVTQDFVDPLDLLDFFENRDGTDEPSLKRDDNDEPLLTLRELMGRRQSVPYNHMTLVDKLISLAPLDIGVMFAGIAAIGDRTVKSIVEEFSAKEAQGLLGQKYTVATVSQRLLEMLREHYARAYPESGYQEPSLELMVGGYDSDSQIPCIVRVRVHENNCDEPDYDYAVYFGAQRTEIARLVFGMDYETQLSVEGRSREMLSRYKADLERHLQEQDIDVALPDPDELESDFSIFSDDWGPSRFDAAWGQFSVQNAIECVDFLVNIMIRSHQFNQRLPSVGGPAQIGVIRKNRGFVYVSERVWRHGGNVIQIEEVSHEQ